MKHLLKRLPRQKVRAAYVFNASVELVHATILKNLNTTKNNQTPCSAALQIFNRTTKQTFVATNSLVINLERVEHQSGTFGKPCVFSAKCVYDSIDVCILMTSCGIPIAMLVRLLRDIVQTYSPQFQSMRTGRFHRDAEPDQSGWRLDSTMRTYSDLATCGNAGIDYFGNKRPSSGCMPGAVEPRQN